MGDETAYQRHSHPGSNKLNKRYMCCVTFRLTGAKPASAAPLVERPYKRWLGRAL